MLWPDNETSARRLKIVNLLARLTYSSLRYPKVYPLGRVSANDSELENRMNRFLLLSHGSFSSLND